MKTDAVHLILDLWLDGPWDNQWCAQIEAAIDRYFTVVQKNRHQFEPHGETVAFILSESHFTLHSYPEENYISVDVYICRKNYDFLPLINELEGMFPIRHIHYRTFKRGEYALPWFERFKDSEKSLVLATFIVAACSLFYELILAQTLSAILGDTAHRYNVTIGLYIASMGFGALLYERLNIKNKIQSFIRVEVVLAFVGASAPLLALIWDYLWRDTGAASYYVISVGLHSLIILIGVLSGLELPLLMDMGEEKREGFGTQILAVDYLGTLCAAICFPLILMPLFQLFSIPAIVAGLNALVALLFAIHSYYKDRNKKNVIWIVASAVIVSVCIALVFNADGFSHWAVQKFYLGGSL